MPGEPPLLCASFSKLWPVDDMQDRMLGPRMEEAQLSARRREVLRVYPAKELLAEVGDERGVRERLKVNAAVAVPLEFDDYKLPVGIEAQDV